MRPKTFDQTQALQAAMLQFWETGYEGSSMQILLRRMGISRQSLYDTYGSKRELFEAALARYRAEVIAPKISELRDPGRSPLESVRRYLQSIADGACGVPVGCLMVRTATETPSGDAAIGAMLSECVRAVHEALADRVAEGQVRGEIDRGRRPAELATAIVVCGMGLEVLRRLPDRQTALSQAVDSLLAGLIERSPGTFGA